MPALTYEEWKRRKETAGEQMVTTTDAGGNTVSVRREDLINKTPTYRQAIQRLNMQLGRTPIGPPLAQDQQWQPNGAARQRPAPNVTAQNPPRPAALAPAVQLPPFMGPGFDLNRPDFLALPDRQKIAHIDQAVEQATRMMGRPGAQMVVQQMQNNSALAPLLGATKLGRQMQFDPMLTWIEQLPASMSGPYKQWQTAMTKQAIDQFIEAGQLDKAAGLIANFDIEANGLEGQDAEDMRALQAKARSNKAFVPHLRDTFKAILERNVEGKLTERQREEKRQQEAEAKEAKAAQEEAANLELKERQRVFDARIKLRTDRLNRTLGRRLERTDREIDSLDKKISNLFTAWKTAGVATSGEPDASEAEAGKTKVDRAKQFEYITKELKAHEERREGLIRLRDLAQEKYDQEADRIQQDEAGGLPGYEQIAQEAGDVAASAGMGAAWGGLANMRYNEPPAPAPARPQPTTAPAPAAPAATPTEPAAVPDAGAGKSTPAAKPKGKPLDRATAEKLYEEAGGDPAKAEELARRRGYAI